MAFIKAALKTRGALVDGLSSRADVRLWPRRRAGNEAIRQSCDVGEAVSISGGQFARLWEAFC